MPLQSHTCVAANARVSSKHSKLTSMYPNSRHAQFRKHHTPHSHHNIAQVHHTPHAHPAHSSTSKHIKLPPLHAKSDKHATQTHAPKNHTNTTPSTHKREQTTRARTFPAATITTPELSPDTATGVSRFVPEVPSPTCAHHKESQNRITNPTSQHRYPSPPCFRKTPLHLPV
jgi:hypothetical protein